MIRNVLSSLAVLSVLAMPLAAHADTFAGTAAFSDTSNSGNNFANFSGVFAHSPFSFSGPVGTVYTDQLTITSTGFNFLADTATDNIAVNVVFTAPNGATGGFVGTGSDAASFLGLLNADTINWATNTQTVHFTDGSSVRLTLPDFSFIGGSNPNSGSENLTITVLTAPTPEPSTLALMGTGVLSAAGVLRRKFAA